MSAAIELTADVSDPLGAALLEIASLTEQLALRDAKIAELQQLYQRTLHRAERAEAGLRAEVIESAQTWGLEIRCDGNCGVTPLRIKVAPPEDAVPGWVRGMGWAVDGDNHWCPGCAPQCDGTCMASYRHEIGCGDPKHWAAILAERERP